MFKGSKMNSFPNKNVFELDTFYAHEMNLVTRDEIDIKRDEEPFTAWRVPHSSCWIGNAFALETILKISEIFL